MFRRFAPRAVGADGNYLYRAVSLALYTYGSEKLHGYIRLLVGMEIISKPQIYDKTSSTFAQSGYMCFYYMHTLQYMVIRYMRLRAR